MCVCVCVLHVFSLSPHPSPHQADLVLWSPAFFGTKPEMVLKSGNITYSQMGLANASIPTTQPICMREMYAGGSGGAAGSSIAFVSQVFTLFKALLLFVIICYYLLLFVIICYYLGFVIFYFVYFRLVLRKKYMKIIILRRESNRLKSVGAYQSKT